MKKVTRVVCVEGENVSVLTNGRIYETYRGDHDKEGLTYITDDTGARIGFFSWRFEVLSEPSPAKNTDKKWSFTSPRLLSIDWDLIASELSYASPVALVTSTEQLSNKQKKDGVVARKIFFVIIHESIHMKAATCNIPLPTTLGSSINRADRTTVSCISEEFYADAVKWVRLVKAAKWPEGKNVSSSVTVTLPVL